MAKLEFVRKNVITNKYEHLARNGTAYHWAPGVSGLDWISNSDIVLADIQRGVITLSDRSSNDGFTYLMSYEDYSKHVHGNYIKNLTTHAYEFLDFINSYDIGIRELQTNKKPIISLTPETDMFFKEAGITSATDINVKVLSDIDVPLGVIADNPIYDLNYKLNYKWQKNGITYSNEPQIVINSANSDIADWQCDVENEAGNTSTTRFNIEFCNPIETKKFYTNLIKNGDGTEGMSNWTVVYGSPEVHKIGNYPMQKDDMFFTEAYVHRNWLGSYAEQVEPFGPRPSKILTGNPIELDNNGYYFRGGVAGNESDTLLDHFTVMKQNIDLSTVADYIDRKIYGVTDVYGCLFGWLGNMGQACGYNSYETNTDDIHSVTWAPNNAVGLRSDTTKKMSWNSLSLIKPGATFENIFNNNLLILDKVYIQVKMFDAKDTEIKCEYVMYSPVHMGEDFKLFLRCQHLYIPYGVRRLEVWVRFQRNDYAIWQPFQYNSSTNLSVSTRVQWARAAAGEITQQHTAAAQQLNLHLYVNNTDEYFDKLRYYLPSIHFRQYEMPATDDLPVDIITDSYTVINGRFDSISNHGQFIQNRFKHSNSAIHLKVYDLYMQQDIKLFNDLFNTIYNIAWFRDRFRQCEIWNAIIDAVIEYQIDIDLTGIVRQSCPEMYYDPAQHYPNSPVETITAISGGNDLADLVVAFAMSSSSINSPVFTTFSNQSTGDNITSYLWEFGDGSTAITQNATHTYIITQISNSQVNDPSSAEVSLTDLEIHTLQAIQGLNY